MQRLRPRPPTVARKIPPPLPTRHSPHSLGRASESGFEGGQCAKLCDDITKRCLGGSRRSKEVQPERVRSSGCRRFETALSVEPHEGRHLTTRARNDADTVTERKKAAASLVSRLDTTKGARKRAPALHGSTTRLGNANQLAQCSNGRHQHHLVQPSHLASS